MTRLIRACAVACALTIPLAGCVSGRSVSTVASNVGIPSSLVTKAQTYAKAACGILPAAESVASIFAAASGTTASAEELATIACQALTLKAAYVADGPQAARQPAPARAKPGATVTGTAIINGKPVPVTGVVTK